jgi:hyperosmotically inducible protein
MNARTLIRNAGVGVILLAFGGAGIGATTANARALAGVSQQKQNFTSQQNQLSNQVRQKLANQLAIFPGYNVFDNLQYRMNGSRVTLFGEVVNPVLRSDAENSVKSIKGVSQVVNKIKVLPLSRFDNQIRWAEYRSIFSDPSLNRYSMGTIPSIHIIVDNGHVTLVGYVSDKMDRQLAGTRARQVPNVFSVTNDLRVG